MTSTQFGITTGLLLFIAIQSSCSAVRCGVLMEDARPQSSYLHDTKGPWIDCGNGITIRETNGPEGDVILAWAKAVYSTPTVSCEDAGGNSKTVYMTPDATEAEILAVKLISRATLEDLLGWDATKVVIEPKKTRSQDDER